MTQEEIRRYQELSIKVMSDSIQERRSDAKPSPYVGAVLVRDDGSVVTAYRGELREGDHAEFTLIERKCRSEKLDGYTLFATLEPCAPGARHFPKLGCAERIVNARIGKVYIGIEDPDPTVCRKGIAHLLNHGIEVEMYPQDLQKEIEDCNKEFLAAAYERARKAEEEDKQEEIVLSQTEKAVPFISLDELDYNLLRKFMEKANMADLETLEGAQDLLMLGIVDKLDEDGKSKYVPTGQGLLLFGKRPEMVFHQAVIRAIYKTQGKNEDIETIVGPLVEQPGLIFKWYEEKLGRQIDRSEPGRRYIYDYPIAVINELVKNAILHRDYDIEGAPIYMEINDDAIIIKSPGYAVPPIKLSQIANFNAPSLSRNPKIMFVFDALNLAEQRGLGFMTVRELPEKYGFPLPIVSYEEPYLVITLPRNAEAVGKVDYSLADLDEGEVKMLNFFRLNEAITLGKSEMVEKMKISSRTAERELKHLVDLGYLEREGAGRSTVYRLAKKG